jgi:shikimate dehydrogenase
MAHDFRFGLFGHPVAHSLSPVMHAASFRSLGIDAEYLCFDVSPEALAARLDACRDGGLNGLNLTVPHKAAAVALMDRLDRSAHLFGAVNTVRIDAGKLTGFNTDAEGFLEDLAVNCRVTPEDRRVLILGCGGAGRALAIACASRGASEVMLANRTAIFRRHAAVYRQILEKPLGVGIEPRELAGVDTHGVDRAEQMRGAVEPIHQRDRRRLVRHGQVQPVQPAVSAGVQTGGQRLG